MTDPLDFLICVTCGVQYTETLESERKTCPVCDDPRQYVGPAGQCWTTLRCMRESGKYKNTFTPVIQNAPANSGGNTISCRQLISIQTTPQVAIGQRALLCISPNGNILWDCITYLDDETVATIKSYGTLHAIVISHPHYFSTCLHWAEAFGCPVYISAEDEEWIMRRSDDTSKMVIWSGHRKAFSPSSSSSTTGDSSGEDKQSEFLCVKTGGHFPGSSVFYWPAMRKLLIADSIYVVPSGVYHIDRPLGTASFSFMWSYPNLIPLPPDEILKIWDAIKDLEFDDTHSAFAGRDTYGRSRQRVLESAKIIVKAMGYNSHAIHAEEA
ncbi:putative metallo-beta-lactamase domain protein [Talaromyces proteolyticus]|uniref:Metallo-beta-lactamase domain protein n=1 Tax=Talaromyces proteolyticus TaxID=1131652 RepID=A0AAD4L0U5_9EURO|nr:putative metallo-beta-lactamase domain protein [Talaromyces proteolyticus]KAH8702056.1 putative metallo-beta-lactamase domain protein [Talaromyces proteolyticus]